MNDRDVAKLIAFIEHLWAGQTVRRDDEWEQIKAWRKLLDGFSLDEAESAVATIVTLGSDFPPSLSKIVEAMIVARDAANHGPIPTPGEAWREVQWYAARRGIRRGPPATWTHPVVGKAVTALGWRPICLESNQATLRAHFFRLFDAERQRYLETRTIPTDNTPQLTTGESRE